MCQGPDVERDIRKATRTNFLLTNKSVYKLFGPEFYCKANFALGLRENVHGQPDHIRGISELLDDLFDRMSSLCLQHTRYLRIYESGMRLFLYTLADEWDDHLLPGLSSLLNDLHTMKRLPRLTQIGLSFRMHWFRAYKQPLKRAYLVAYVSRYGPMEDWSFWWRFVGCCGISPRKGLERTCEEEYPSIEIIHSLKLTFELEAGRRTLVAREGVNMPTNFKEVMVHEWVITLARRKLTPEP